MENNEENIEKRSIEEPAEDVLEKAAGDAKNMSEEAVEEAGEALENASEAAEDAAEDAADAAEDAVTQKLTEAPADEAHTETAGEELEETAEESQAEAADEAKKEAADEVQKQASAENIEFAETIRNVSEKVPENIQVNKGAVGYAGAAPGLKYEYEDDEYEDDEYDYEEEGNGKKAAVVIIIIIAALAALYFWGRSYFGKHFYPGTVINEYDASRMTPTELKNDIQQDLTNYVLTVKERDNKKEYIYGSKIDLLYKDSGEISRILEDQNPNLWILHIFERDKYHSVNDSVTYDEGKLQQQIDALECFRDSANIPPEDACIVRRDNAFVIEPEKNGSLLDKKAASELIVKAIDAGDYNVDFDKEGAYVKPQVLSNDENLLNDLKELNEVTSAHIIYDFSDRQWEVDAETIASWVEKNAEGRYEVNYDLVYAWVTDMAYETDTFGLAHDFMTSYGVPVRLEAGGDYGWCIDKEETTEHLIQYVNDKAEVVIQPDYLYTGLDRSVNDIGNTYVEICIRDQHMWCYLNGQCIVETPVITGRVGDGYATPSGSVWAIDAKKEDWQFTGYSDSHSDYWMPFNGPVGIHDADWQSPENYYIPDYYYWYGSHGCVNTPLDAVRVIYQNMEIGYPVVCYYSVDQVHGPDNTERLTEGW